MKKVSVNTLDEWAAHLKCRKFYLVGFRIMQTIDKDGKKLDQPTTIAATDDVSKYNEALNVANQNRKTVPDNGKLKYGPWCIVANEYSCGHIIF